LVASSLKVWPFFFRSNTSPRFLVSNNTSSWLKFIKNLLSKSQEIFKWHTKVEMGSCRNVNYLLGYAVQQSFYSLVEHYHQSNERIIWFIANIWSAASRTLQTNCISFQYFYSFIWSTGSCRMWFWYSLIETKQLPNRYFLIKVKRL